MGSLREELLEQEADDFVAVIDGDPERIDNRLSALWESYLREGDYHRMVHTAIIWTPQQMIALATCRCVPMIATRRPAEVWAALEITEQWAHGAASLHDVWDAKSAVKAFAYGGDLVASAATWAAGAAGDNESGFDEEGLRSACEAISAVLALRGEGVRPAIVQAFRETIPRPTLAALIRAHEARNTDE